MAEDRHGQKLASDDLNDIEELRKNPAFSAYWSRRVLSKLDDARDSLLHGKLTYSNDPVERQRLNIWEEVFTILLDDERACRNILASVIADRE